MSIKLDMKDRKIIYELDKNSRIPFSQLAKRVNISKDAVIYRIERLKKLGVIKSFRVMVDVGKLGYTNFRFFLKLQNTTPEKEEEILRYLIEHPKVGWIVSVEGNWNINMWVYVRSLHEMNDFWKELLKRYKNFIEKRWLSIFTKVTFFNRAYLLNKKVSEKACVFITLPNPVNVDKTDLKILRLLSKNARMPIVGISNILGLSEKTVSKRIREMEMKGVIVGYRTIFDLSKLGYEYYKIHITLHNVIEEKEREFKLFTQSHPNVVYDDEVLGGDDFEIEVQVENPEQLRIFIDDMKRRFSNIIKTYDVLHYYKEYKLVFVPEDIEEIKNI